MTDQIIAVVGAEGNRFTAQWEAWARRRILEIIQGASLVVSGACPKGGIDIWTDEEAHRIGIPFRSYPPTNLSWPAFKSRNKLIAEQSHKIVCITVRHYPPELRGRRDGYCYHCGIPGHIRTGGCWTMRYAHYLGRQTDLIIVGD